MFSSWLSLVITDSPGFVASIHKIYVTKSPNKIQEIHDPLKVSDMNPVSLSDLLAEPIRAVDQALPVDTLGDIEAHSGGADTELMAVVIALVVAAPDQA